MNSKIKKVLSFALAGITALTVFPFTGMAKTYYLGDVDGNGKIEAADALVVLQYSVGRTETIDTKAADITKDGKIDSGDALAILQTSVGLKKPVQVTEEEHKAKPIGKVEKPWPTINGSTCKIDITRLAYGSEQTFTVNASNRSTYHKDIVNYKTFKYQPKANVAVITPKNGTYLRFSKGSNQTDPETIAKSVDATIAVNGMFTSYETDKCATVRDGAVYKSYTGAAGKAARRMVVYKNGDWKVLDNFDNNTAKAEIAKGAWVSIRYQDITVSDGKNIADFPENGVYRNRTFIGHTYDGKVVFLTTEMMPVKSAGDILVAYNCKDAVQINGGNSTYMYVKGLGNTTGSTSASIKSLNKVGYLETEWYAKNGLFAAGKGGGLSYTDLDCAFFK